jgi:hypothetical protein
LKNKITKLSMKMSNTYNAIMLGNFLMMIGSSLFYTVSINLLEYKVNGDRDYLNVNTRELRHEIRQGLTNALVITTAFYILK